MPINARDLALDTLLLMTVATLGLMGVVGSLFGLSESHSLFAVALVPDAAIATSLASVGVFAILQGWQRMRWLCALALTGLALYTLVHNVLASPDPSWLTGQERMTSIGALMLLAVGLALWCGQSTARRRLFWLFSGLGQWLFGGLMLVRLWVGIELDDPMFSSSPVAVVVFTLLLGTAMVGVYLRRSPGPLNLTRTTAVACLTGVAASAAAWGMLSLQQFNDTQQQAGYLLDNVQLNAEKAVKSRLQLLQRMAERINAAPGNFDQELLTLDGESYLRDTPSLQAIALVDERLNPIWFHSRTSDSEEWLRQQLDKPSVPEWLSVPFDRPWVVISDPYTPSLAFVAMPLAERDQRLVASLDLAVLFNYDLRLELGPFQVNMSRSGTPLLMLQPPLAQVDRALHPGRVLAKRKAGLPGGISLRLEALSGSHHNWYLAGFAPVVVAMVGLMLSGLLAFCVGLVVASIARAKELAEARQTLEDQQHIQQMIAQEAPLDDILESLCRLLERQLPGSLCSVMLANKAKTHLTLVAGKRLPDDFREAVERVRIAPSMGACGSAAYQRCQVISECIADDERWQGFHEVARRAGLVACWSSPVMGSNGQLLGTFATYSHQPRVPDEQDHLLIEKAAGLMALAVERFQVRRSLEESEQRYRSLFTHHPDAVFSLDEQGRFATANATCATISGYTLDEIIGSHFNCFIYEEDIESVNLRYQSVMQGSIIRYELVIRDRAGEPHIMDLINLPIVIDGEIQGLYGIAQEVTDKRQQESRLRTLERSVEASVNGVVIADAIQPGLPIVYANHAFAQMTGYDQAEILGHNCRFLQGEETDPEVVEKIRQRLSEQRDVHVTLRNYRKDGSLFWNDLYIAPVRNPDGQLTHFVGVQHDISKHKAFEARLAYHATHDDLTQLPNRSLFEETLSDTFTKAQTQQQRVAVLFVDLDDFKPINDNLGHAVGDRVLEEVAQRLLGAVGEQHLVARLGGDEFVIMHPKVNDEVDVVEVAERLLAALSRPYYIEEHELYLTASVGIAISEEALLEPQMLIQQADMAMYKAKQRGRNAYQWFSAAFNDTASERLVLRNELQEAIENQVFELYYQPLLDRNGQLEGVEALLRWPHPTKGFISPARFIPLAEATGQIMPISEWVLNRACDDMQVLAQQGLGEVSVAVNVSPLQFQRSNFLASLHQTLADTGLPPKQLALEITEGILMENTEVAIDTLRALRNMDVRVSIDDFGTGFSSLNYLKHLPVSTVKIDRSFIHELHQSEADSAIVKGIISMAHHLGLNVVAEGVETSEQHHQLLDYHCDVFQGFGLARPMPLASLITFIDALDQQPVVRSQR
ncbi:PAS domain S-box-containing protein/diguanylate cyclase (GGDEF) domain-containing protein [Vreelandella subterranea]|uniref:cyclic-guanylate-specific phosphodiesterase n=1 Tax=Vreelandella subterranea TaxID=416874 RepID=A0A1H9TMV4_9GAMM|nr:EAL domain-containing protein [Halomonas subterranea]SER97943.1 PAS domain S-box-containing protein/diguanylate cyclase (GGDEF) domain-containing protein [Halomonas subterranea]